MIRVCLFCFVCLLTYSAVVKAQAPVVGKTVWLSNSIDWPPYAWVDDKKILRNTLDRIGFQLDYIQGIPLKMVV